jgi:hypothetical protein
MNRYTTRVRGAALIGLVTAVSACSDLTGLNENTNAPEDVGPEFLLPQSIRSAAQGGSFNATMMLSHTGIWAGHVVQIQYPDEETGLVRPQNMDAFWQNYYTGPLADIQLVVEKGRANNAPNQEAVGMIWRSWLFHQVSDLWGDIPYSEALAGRDLTRPVYDTQESVYRGLVEELAAAAGMLNLTVGAAPPPAGGGFGAGDILYGNDWEKWRRFANSLGMRLAMRMVNKDAAAARTAFIAAHNAGGFESNADNAVVRWPGGPYENPLYVNYLGRDDHGIAGALVDTLTSLSDPRLDLYAEPAGADGVYRGWYNGHEDPDQPLNHYSRIGNYWRANGATTPSLLMTYAEVLFLRAEAVQRGWIAGDAGELYRQGITAAMTQFAGADGPTPGEIAAYLAQPRVAYNPATGLQQIHLQLWIALYMNENEAFAHWRRTGVPQLTPGPDLIVSRIPVRFQYPPNEQSFNSSNLNTAVSRQGLAAGGADLVTPVWWMP